MGVKVFCLLLLVACAYGALLPSLDSISSAAKPFTDALGQGEKMISSLTSGKSDDSKSDSKSDEESDEKSSKEEKEIQKLVKKMAEISEKLLHSVDLENPQAKNLAFSIKALVDQLVSQAKAGNLKERDRRDLGDIMKTISSALKPSGEKSGKGDKEVEKLVKELEKISGKLLELVGKDNIQARNILLSIKGLAGQLSGVMEMVNRVPRDIGDITETVSKLLGQNGFSELLNLVPLGSNLTSILSKVDFSKVAEIPKIPALQDVEKLPVLPGLKENILYARNLTKLALGGIGQKDLPSVIQSATEKAIHSVVPISALTAMLSTILHIYYDIAVNSPLYVVGAAVLQDGLVTIAAVVKSVVSVIANDIKNIISG